MLETWDVDPIGPQDPWLRVLDFFLFFTIQLREMAEIQLA